MIEAGGFIKSCPYTLGSCGTVTIDEAVIACLAGAVRDKIEWLILLTGKVITDGEVHVTGYSVPKQSRSQSSCNIVGNIELEGDTVGVLHSHHTMGAFMSTTDDQHLNTRFPLSIVISSKGTGEQEARLLGFAYKAVGNRVLPCGDVGQVPYYIKPYPIPEGWPLPPAAKMASSGTNPGLCERVVLHPTKPLAFSDPYSTACGITGELPSHAIFGRQQDDILKEIQQQTVYVTVQQQGLPDWHVKDRRRIKLGKNKKKGLRSWNEVGELNPDDFDDLFDDDDPYIQAILGGD